MPMKSRKKTRWLPNNGSSRLEKRVDGLSRKIGLMRRESKREFKKVHLESAREFKKVRQESAREFKKVRQESAREFKKVRQESAREFKKVRQESAREFKKVRQESAREFKKVRQESARESHKLRQEMKQAFSKFEAKIQKQFVTFGGMLLARIEAIEQNDAKFRNEILTMMDFVRKQYDEFHTEKTSLWAGQSRLENEINRLKESDSDQNEALSNLNGRVTQLETA